MNYFAGISNNSFLTVGQLSEIMTLDFTKQGHLYLLRID